MVTESTTSAESTGPADGGAPVIYDVFPQLHVRGGAAALDFYRRVFGARETMRLAYPDGRIAHAELTIGSVTILLADEHPEYGVRSPLAFGGSGSSIHLHVDDVDRLARRAMEAGATVLRGPEDAGHGERQCRIRDPFGHEWLLGHETEPVSEDEIQRRWIRTGGKVMGTTPDVRPVGDLPNAIGKTAARELSAHGITTLEQVAARSRKELLAIHGVGPKALTILGEAMAARGLSYREP